MLFKFLGPARVKTVRKHVDEIVPQLRRSLASFILLTNITVIIFTVPYSQSLYLQFGLFTVPKNENNTDALLSEALTSLI